MKSLTLAHFLSPAGENISRGSRWPQPSSPSLDSLDPCLRRSYSRFSSPKPRLREESMRRIASYSRPLLGTQPNYLYPPYISTCKRAPKQPLILVPQTQSELTGPVFGH